MNVGLIFSIANAGIIPFWLLLIVAPGWRGTQLLVHSIAIPLILGLTYFWLFASPFIMGPPLPEGGSFFSLTGVMTLFQSPVALTAGWIHYLVFDLFVGAWETRDATRRGFPHWLLIVCLVVTLMVGPIGLMLYLLLRAALGKGGLSLSET
ncbi:MAG: DUF4281 domain-containing protein [Proteobacteria bacterium]|nr:DUF4281 domain-containing protein [Pseudomonadota bacterium]